MKVAVIDLGTNTFHLIIAELLAGKLNILYKTNVPVQLGQGRINENIIVSEAFERGIETLKSFKKEIDSHQVNQLRAIATSAVRSAKNGNDFVNAAKTHAGIAIEMITGDQEAAYIFKGVKATGAIEETSLIMDIGGGSTEFILCDTHNLLWKKSYDIGAARLMQAYFKSDPIHQSDKNALNNHLTEVLADLKTACAKYKPVHLIGSAGAFETFAEMIDQDLNLKDIKYKPIDMAAYQSLAQLLIASTHGEREAMPRLIPLRVDMIVIAAILTNYIISMAMPKQMSVSTYDLKMGILHTLAQSEIG